MITCCRPPKKALSTLSQKSATVAENGEKTATVAEFGDSALFCDKLSPKSATIVASVDRLIKCSVNKANSCRPIGT